jgi:hypothetical protein
MNANPIMILTFLFASLLNLNTSIGAQDNGDELFDNSYLHEIRIESDSIVDLWNAISRAYVMVNVTVDGNALDSVGLRLKGFTSSVSPQKPLKIDINEYVSGKKYDGLKKFNLHNNFMDSFLQREAVAYNLYRKAGLPSPRTAYAEVYVDDMFRGVYSITEQIDKTFLDQNFPSNKGSLYKGATGFAGLSVGLKEGTLSEFDAFNNNLTAANLSDFVNLNSYLKQLATDIIIGDWDSYAYHRHNFYIYYEPKSQLLNFLNWDHNYAFAADERNMDLYPSGTYPSANNLIEDRTLKPMYEQTMCELLTYLVEPSYITDLLTHNHNIINSNSNGVLADDPRSLIDYIANRSERLQDTLSKLGVNCGDLSYPYNPNDLVINEFMASSDSLSGVQEPDGGTPDWIELYNNTSTDITIDKHFYLSDDKDFPKKWNFPEEVTITGDSYLIIWADKDVHQQGIHTGFKIAKDGGDLLMTYEDLTEIQNISYGNQILNKGYARFPNGTGDFVIQEHSFNANNSMVVAVDDIYDVAFTLYPNPTGDFISIESNQPLRRVLFSDVAGKEVSRIVNPQFPLNIEGLRSGIYFMRLDFDGESSTAKIVKE